MAGQFIRIALLIAGSLLLSACVTAQPRMTCDPAQDPDQVAGWCKSTRDIARQSWLYAQMSSNAYLDETEEFILPGNVVQRHVQPNDRLGFAYIVYDLFDGNDLVETVIAYRGTELSMDDWLLANVFGGQNDPGLAAAQMVADHRASSANPQARITVTGHSLGGGIAHYVSLHPIDGEQGSVTRSVVFNNSPRFSGEPSDAERIAVVERGDWLGALRWVGSEPDQLYQSLNCQPGFSPFRDHSIRRLAECLTWIAAFDDPAARLSMAQNPLIDMPPGQVDELRPPVADVLLGPGIPVNPYAAQSEWADALDASLRASEGLSPLYEQATGFRLYVEPDATSGAVAVRWTLNDVEQLEARYDCSALSVQQCTDRIVAEGQGKVPRPPRDTVQ